VKGLSSGPGTRMCKLARERMRGCCDRALRPKARDRSQTDCTAMVSSLPPAFSRDLGPGSPNSRSQFPELLLIRDYF